MNIVEEAKRMLEKHPLCDNCLGRQFAMLGHGLGNDQRGEALKYTLVLEAHAEALSEKNDCMKTLRILALNGFSQLARDTLEEISKRKMRKTSTKKCHLCDNKLMTIEDLVKKASELLEDYEYQTFLVGVELPTSVEEREDEFRAQFEVTHGESMRNEFSRLIGKNLGVKTGKTVDFKRPNIAVVVNPITERVRLQVNPLFISGRYRKLVRGIPQSRWFCSSCRGRGCEKCGWTGKMYPESVEEIVEKPVLDATGGVKGSFHASGREDIDARMLGPGRPFVVEVTQPKKRFLDLDILEEAVNAHGKGRVQVSSLKLADRSTVRQLKKGESTQKEYRVSIEFEKNVTDKDLNLLCKKLTNATIKQRTPTRVLHRRADLTREKYIYEVNVRKVSSQKAMMKVRCQGGLYVKELVSGDEGRTTPSVTELLNNRAKPLKLDVLRVIMTD